MKLTAQQAREQGLTEEEIKMAKEQGTVELEQGDEGFADPATQAKPEDKENNPPADPATQAKPEDKPEEKPVEIAKQQEIKSHVELGLSGKDEQDLIKTYNKNEKALYFRMKKEKVKRQEAEQANEILRSENEKLKIKIAQAEARATVPTNPATSASPAMQTEDPFEGLKEDEVYTGAEIKAMAEKLRKNPPSAAAQIEAAKQAAQQDPNEPEQIFLQEKTKRQLAETTAEIQRQDEEARKIYQDYDKVLEVGKPVLIAASVAIGSDKSAAAVGEAELAELFSADPEKIKKAKILSLEFATLLQSGAKNAAGRKLSEVGYEIGLLLTPTDPAAPSAPAVGGKVVTAGDPNKVQKFVATAAKGTPSAALGGGAGKSTAKSFTELTEKDVASMSALEFAKLPKEIQEKFL